MQSVFNKVNHSWYPILLPGLKNIEVFYYLFYLLSLQQGPYFLCVHKKINLPVKNVASWEPVSGIGTIVLTNS